MGDIGRYGKANGAAPAGAGSRPLQAVAFRIELKECLGVTAIEQNSYRQDLHLHSVNFSRFPFAFTRILFRSQTYLKESPDFAETSAAQKAEPNVRWDR
jgi:hypothetical protein